MNEKTIKYAIQGIACGKLAILDSAQETLKSWSWSRSSGEPTLFDSFGVAVSKVAGIGRHLGPITIVKVEVTPGRAKREVVELEGQVDLRGLKYAFRGAGSGAFYGYSRTPTSLEAVDAFDSLSVAARGNVVAFGDIVGVREVTAPASYTIIPLD